MEMLTVTLSLVLTFGELTTHISPYNYKRTDITSWNTIFLFFFLLSYNSFWPQHSFLPLLPVFLYTSIPPLCSRFSPSIHLHKRAGLLGIPTESVLRSYYKTRHTPSHQGWTRQPGRRERFPRAGERLRDFPTNNVRMTHKNPKLNNHSLYAEDLGKTQAVFLIAATVSGSQVRPA